MENAVRYSGSEAGGKNLLAIVRFLMPTLSKAEKKAAVLLLENPEGAAAASLTEFAQMAGCGQASVIRLCKRMGLAGFAELKTGMVTTLLNGEREPHAPRVAPPQEGHRMRAVLERVFELNIQTLRDTLDLSRDEDYDRALAAMVRAKQICFFAIGDAMIPCEFAALKLRRMGVVCFANKDVDMQFIDACNLEEGDVAIAVSHTGSTRQVVEAMDMARRRGAVTICITKLDKSPLTKRCDIKLFTATADVTQGKEIIARRAAEQAILEALYIGVAQAKQPLSGKRIGETSQALGANKYRAAVKRRDETQ